MQDQQQQQIPSFLHKRRQLILKDVRNRRQLIFNQTRQILKQAQNIDISSSTEYLQQNSKNINQMTDNGHNLNSKLDEQQNSKQFHSQKQSSQRKPIRKRCHKQQYYKNFQYPQWLIDVPQNIDNYYFSLRPFGERVFVHIIKRKMLIISMYGNVIESLNVSKSQYNNSLFEGYYIKCNNNNQTNENNQQNNNKKLLIISDLLVWKENPMTCSQFQFRQMWLMNNFSQQVIKNLVDCKGEWDIKLMTYWQVRGEKLKQLWQNSRQSLYEYKVDGILFHEKDSYYIHGINPQVLLWKNPQVNFKIKSHSIKTSSLIKQEQTCQKQLNLLTLQETINNNLSFYGEFILQKLTLFTLDEVGIVKFQQNNEFVNNIKEKYGKKCIIKFGFNQMQENMSISNENLDNQQFPFIFKDFKIISLHDVNYRIPDSFSKIICKYNIQKGITINFQTLIKKIQSTKQKRLLSIGNKSQSMELQ